MTTQTRTAEINEANTLLEQAERARATSHSCRDNGLLAEALEWQAWAAEWQARAEMLLARSDAEK